MIPQLVEEVEKLKGALREAFDRLEQQARDLQELRGQLGLPRGPEKLPDIAGGLQQAQVIQRY